jgi:hypothetical protein
VFAIVANRIVTSNLAPSASLSDNRVLWLGGRSEIGLCWRRIGDHGLNFGGSGWRSQRSLTADFL